MAVLRLRRRWTGAPPAIYAASSKLAKLNGIDPQAYLADVLNRIADHPIRQIDTPAPLAMVKIAPGQVAAPDQNQRPMADTHWHRGIPCA